MPNLRPQVGDLAGPVPLQPVATPVDTYHTPLVPRPRPQDAELGDVAKALQDIQPSLARFNTDQMQLNMEQGAALAAKNKLQFKEAVEKGVINPGQNPWLAKGYKQQILQVQAHDYDSALRLAWTKSGVSESDNPAEFKQFVQGFSQSYVDKMDLKNDPTFAQTFVPDMMKSQANLLQQHTAYQEQRIVEKAKDATYRNIQSLIDGQHLYTSPENLQAAIKNNVDNMVASGLPGGEANKLTVDAIRDKAKADMDPAILDLMKGLNTGNGDLGKTAYAQEQHRAASLEIFEKQRMMASFEWENRERAKKKIGEDGMIEGATRLGQDPRADISDVLANLEKHNPEAAKSVREYQQTILSNNAKVFEDPAAVADLYSRLTAGTAGPGDIYELGQKRILSPDEVQNAFRYHAEVIKNRSTLDDPEVQRRINRVKATVMGQDYTRASPTEIRHSVAAENLMSDAVMDFKGKNPNASKWDVIQYMEKVEPTILNNFIEDKGAASDAHADPVLTKRVFDAGGAAAPKAPEPAKPGEAPTSIPEHLYKSPADLKAAIEDYNKAPEVGTSRLEHEASALGYDSAESYIKAIRANLSKRAPKK